MTRQKLMLQISRKELILTNKYLYLIGREQIKKGPEKGKLVEVIKRKLSFSQISYVSLSKLQVSNYIYHYIYCIISIIFMIIIIITIKKR